MGDSDDDYDRKGRVKFPGERSSGDNYRSDRRGGRDDRSRGRDDWGDRGRNRPDYRDYRPRDRFSPERGGPPAKRIRGDWGDDGRMPRYGGYAGGGGGGAAGWVPPEHYSMHMGYGGGGGIGAGGGGMGMGIGGGGGGHAANSVHSRIGNQEPLNNADLLTQPPMLTLKQFLTSQDDAISDSDAITKYNDYKLEFKRQQLNEFFVAHKDEEWFKVKYHPDEANKRKEEQIGFLKKRMEVFADLYEKNYVNDVYVDTTQTDALLRLLDIAVIKLEGGTDDDVKVLDEKERSVEIIQKQPESITPVANTKKGTDVSTNKNQIESEDKWDDDNKDPVKKDEDSKVIAKDSLGSTDVEKINNTNEKDEANSLKANEKKRKLKIKAMKEKQKHMKSITESSSSSSGSSSSDEDDEDEDENEEEDDDDDGGDANIDKYDVSNAQTENEKQENVNAPSPEHDNENNINITGRNEKRKSIDENTSSNNDQSAENDNNISNKSDDENNEKNDKLSEKSDENIVTIKIDDDNKTETIDLDKEGDVNDKPGPRALHRTSSIFLRNLAPTITKSEVEAMCKRYSGFLRVAIADPLVERRWFRRGWVTFKRDVNIKEICWNLNNIRLRDCELGAIVNRDLSRRIRPVNGITAHKPIVRNDIKICAKVAHNLDIKAGLWSSQSTVKSENGTIAFGLNSNNPVLQNITDYLIEEGSAEEDELLGLTNENRDSDGELLERDQELISVLDKLILYLRIVHSVDFYNHCEYPYEDEMPNRCGIIHARGPAPQNKVSNNEIQEYIRGFELKMSSFISRNQPIDEEELKKNGCKDVEAEIEKFVQANTQELAKDKWLCPLSGKKFKGPEFIRKHIFNKHEEKVDEVRKEVEYFNAYLRDPKRPQLPEHPGNNRKIPIEQPPQANFRGYPGPVGYMQPYAAYAPPMIIPARPRGGGFGGRRGGGGGDYRPIIHYRDLDAPREPEDFL